jgi:hypothetical protein
MVVNKEENETIINYSLQKYLFHGLVAFLLSVKGYKNHTVMGRNKGTIIVECKKKEFF